MVVKKSRKLVVKKSRKLVIKKSRYQEYLKDENRSLKNNAASSGILILGLFVAFLFMLGACMSLLQQRNTLVQEIKATDNAVFSMGSYYMSALADEKASCALRMSDVPLAPDMVFCINAQLPDASRRVGCVNVSGVGVN